jgi:hypothetical protein
MLFYTHLNGGYIGNVKYITLRLERFKEYSVSVKEAFARAFLENPITKEILQLTAVWDSFRGQLFPPTRVKAVERLYTEQAQAKSSKSLSTKRKNVGDPNTKQLPSIYYTSVEFIFMAFAVASIVDKATEMGSRIGLVQGIHDGFLFVSPDKLDVASLVQDVNVQLFEASKVAMGVPLQLSLAYCEDAVWLASRDAVLQEDPEGQGEELSEETPGDTSAL